MYVAFTDLKNAFHSMMRQTVQSIVQGRSVHHVCKRYKAIHLKVLSCDKIGNEFTDMFECPQGLRQGCTLGATLFSMILISCQQKF